MTLKELKIKYVTDVFILCGHSIKRTQEATNMWPEEIKRYLSIDHKTPVTEPTEYPIVPWKTVERKHILEIYRKFEYCKLDTRTALGLSAGGFTYKLKKLDILKVVPWGLTPISLFISAGRFGNIHDWFDTAPEEIQAAYSLGVTDEIKRELRW